MHLLRTAWLRSAVCVPVLQDGHDLPDFRAKRLRLRAQGFRVLDGDHANDLTRSWSIDFACS
ncbi:hypothetical protein, partial [Methanoculleus sp. UBA340]|uniref:hypothetical protein n=1 Tax=Methanoculleus sp. UBA340 TaxID=1915504 RepID=UPI00319EAD58